MEGTKRRLAHRLAAACHCTNEIRIQIAFRYPVQVECVAHSRRGLIIAFIHYAHPLLLFHYFKCFNST